MTTRAFRFAYQAKPGTPKEWRETARQCEDLGYSAVQIADHLDPASIWSPIVALSVAAEATSRILVGPLVLCNDFKHPAVVAKEYATLQLASDGRVELGIGAGWMRADYEWLGLPYDRPGIRVDRLAEAVKVIKCCLAADSFSFSGKHYTICDYAARPAVPSPVPLMIGGGSPRVLALAAREADIVGVNPNLGAGVVDTATMRTSLSDITDRKIEWIRAAAGERLKDIELQSRYFIAAVTPDRRGHAERIAPGFGITAEEVLDGATSLIGSVDEICEQLLERRERWGFSYIVFGTGQPKDFAAVVERLAGS